MKRILFITILFICSSTVFSQQVQLIKTDGLYDRIENGKDTLYIINFWATWCAPCIRELPFFEKFGEQYQNEKFKILLVSVDFKSQLKNSVIPFVKKKKFKNEVFLLDEEDQQKFISEIDESWSGAIPATLFVKNDVRKFVEKELTYDELVNHYKSFQA